MKKLIRGIIDTIKGKLRGDTRYHPLRHTGRVFTPKEELDKVKDPNNAATSVALNKLTMTITRVNGEVETKEINY